MQSINPQQALQKIRQGARLIDVRGRDEYAREHIAEAALVPLSELQSGELPRVENESDVVIFHCKSGMRTADNAQLLAQAVVGAAEVYLLEGGLDGWRRAGLPTVINRGQPLELMRQVQIAAGSLVLLGVLLGYWVSPGFYLLSGFVGCGLVVAGVTGFCGMARLLKVMPWNKRGTV